MGTTQLFEKSSKQKLLQHDRFVQLSGIGPAETLEKFGIPVLADLPVGEDAHV
jgi:hypothetical protein